jgi:hypothetical protein
VDHVVLRTKCNAVSKLYLNDTFHTINNIANEAASDSHEISFI